VKNLNATPTKSRKRGFKGKKQIIGPEDTRRLRKGGGGRTRGTRMGGGYSSSISGKKGGRKQDGNNLAVLATGLEGRRGATPADSGGEVHQPDSGGKARCRSGTRGERDDVAVEKRRRWDTQS